MPTPGLPRPSLLFSFAALAALAALSACGSSTSAITVAGKSLSVVEVSYGKSGTPADSAMQIPFCSPLVNSQFEVIFTDFPLCQQTRMKVGNTTLFHSSDEANMRLIFPTMLLKNTDGSFKTNTFNVGSTTGCTKLSGQPATAFFAHATKGVAAYDVNLEASAGSISVTAYDGQSDLQGTYDLTFGNDRVTGSFEATYCSGLAAQYGQ
jgi:hypothetical protein